MKNQHVDVFSEVMSWAPVTPTTQILQYSQRGSRIFRESLWLEIDHGLKQVTQVKPRIHEVQVITKSPPSRFRSINFR
jgi:hypothetical protein